jgi:hypothetical protein
MAGPGRAESASVPIWLKLSEVDAARMEKVLARPEFAGWTKAEWCLEIIQTALRYYTKTRPEAEAARGAAPEAPQPVEPPPVEREPVEPEPEPVRAAAAPVKPVPLEPEEPEQPETEPVAAEPVAAEAVAAEPVAKVQEPPDQAECPHPADARDYQTGTCAVCGAILWD